MELNDLLTKQGLDPKTVLVMRHRPREPELHKVLPWLAAERPDTYNAYQQTQSPKAEKAMQKANYVASFIGHEAGKALFVGIYRRGASRPLTLDEYWQVDAYIEMRDKYGLGGFDVESVHKQQRASLLWFDLELTENYIDWKGRLVIEWPPPERSWWRWAGRNTMPVHAIHERSILVREMPSWDQLLLTWHELQDLPSTWKAALRQWRGIYYIFDQSDEKGYIGSAYGSENLLGRWQDYAKRGHGGNKRLRERKPDNFRFSILQRVSPDLDAADVIQLEATWKDRLHTREYGLNEN